MKIRKIAATFTLALLSTVGAVNAQVVGPDVYIQGNYVEIGVRGDFGYEGLKTTTSPVPPGYHPRSGGAALFGFVANPQMNNWDIPGPGLQFDGDFFTPGSPENGWGFEIVLPAGAGSIKKSNNCANPTDMSGSSYSYVVDPATGCITQSGSYPYVDAGSGIDLNFDITYKLKPNDLYYTTVVKITNNGTSTLDEFYYYRNVDPDNNQPVFGTFTTVNTIVANPSPGSTCNKAHVEATMTNTTLVPGLTWISYLGFAAIGPEYRVSKGGFSNRDASDIWNGTGGLVTTVGSTSTADEAISLAYRILNFAPGQTEEVKFVVILNAASADAAISNLFYFDYAGGLGGPPPECVTIVDTALTCTGKPVTITLNSPVIADFTWSWSPSAGLSTTTGPVTDASPAVPTMYTITGVSVSGCYNDIVQNIYVDLAPGPNADYIDPGPQCGTFDITTLTFSDLNAVPGTGHGFYSVVPTTLTDTVNNIFTGPLMTPADSVYLVYWDPVLGCIDYEKIDINWGGVPVTLNVTHPTCAGNDGVIVVNASGGSGVYTYQLDGGAFVSSNTFTGLSLGNHVITVSDGSGCNTTVDTLLQNGALPMINSTSQTMPTCLAVCNGTITVLASGLNTPLQYSVDGGAYQASNVLASICDGTHTVTVMDNVGCTVSTSVTLVAGTFTITPSMPVTICIGQTTTISATTTGGSGIITTDWDNGVPNGASQNVSPTTTTTYSVFATDGVGCTTNTSTVTVTVNPPLAVTTSANTTVCPGDTAAISALASGGNGGPYNYVWTNNMSAGSLFGASQDVVAPNNPTIYTVSVTDNCGTPAVTSTVTVGHHPLPAVTYNIDNQQGCTPVTVNFQNTTALTGSAAWSYSDGGSDIGSTPTHTFYNNTNSTICYDITLTVTTVDGCVVDTTIASQICAFPIPVPDFSWNPNPTDIFNVDVDFTNLTIGGTTYLWDFYGAGTSTDVNPSWSFPYDSAGIYPICLTATNTYGCVDTICHNVEIQGVFLLYAPNAFTPDGNGTNDIFLPKLQGEDPASFELYIFNRWGELVFKSTDINTGWDGLHKSIKAKEDTYVWKVKVKAMKDAKKYEYTGHVTLLR